jgi:hypothetical protein
VSGHVQGVLGEVEAGQLGVVGLVHDADVGVAPLAEVLPARIGIVDRHGHDDPVRLGRHAGEVRT